MKLYRDTKERFNIFDSAIFKLTMFYFLIITGISLIFNVVIFTTVNTNKTDISPTIDLPTKQRDRDYSMSIIRARNHRAEEQIFAAMMILDSSILLLSGWGSYILARKTLKPLEEAHDLQAQFVSNVSHELKTPLASMQLESELVLRNKSSTKQEMRETINSNLEEIQSLNSLLQTLLKLSQISSKITTEPVNLNKIIKQSISKFPSEKIKLSSNKSFIIDSTDAITSELAIILIDNALKYRKDNTTITVDIFREHKQVVLSVSNKSGKIPKDEISKLFDRFYRQDQSRSCNSKCEGRGLGLAIAKKLTESIGANITAENRKNKNGEFETTFKIYFRFA